MSLKSKFTEKQIRKHLFLRGRIWYFDLRIGRSRRQRSLHTADKEIAVRRTLELFQRLENISTSQRTLSGLYDKFVEARPDRARRYLQGVKKAIDLFQEVVGDRKLSEITKKHVAAFRVAMISRPRAGKAPAKVITGYTVNNYNRMLRSAFEIAVEKEWIDRNPFKHFEKTRQMTKLPRAYSPADYSSYRSKAAEVYGEDFAIVLDLYLLLGLRDGEGTMLEWEYFDLELGILNVPPEITKALHERIVPLPQYAVQILKVLKAKGHSRPIDFNASTLSHRWIKLRRGGRYKGKDFVGTGIPGTFHNLRKSTVTYLKKAGLNPDFIDIMVGHRRKGVSAENYTDYELSLDVVRDHLEKVAGIFFPGNSARNVKTETTSSLTEYGGLRLVRIVRA